jgi:tripartite-type tricarboxylate transporter receptor subunit TctC
MDTDSTVRAIRHKIVPAPGPSSEEDRTGPRHNITLEENDVMPCASFSNRPAAIRALRLSAWLLAALAALITPPAGAQSYPSQPIRIVVPFPPGGGTDILSRILAQKLNEAWRQSVVVDNRAGAGGTIGSALVAKSPGDGYTLLVMPAGIAAHASLYQKLPYDPVRDLAPVSRLASGPLVLVVHPSVPAKSIKEFVALAKKHPGEINFGSAGSGTLPHLSAELFNSMSVAPSSSVSSVSAALRG